MNDRIRRARKMRELTQEELGRKIDRSGMYISRVEKGEKLLSDAQISTIASALDVNEKWLRTGTGPMTANELTRDRRTIGERLYQVRKRKEMTQAKFGSLLGVSRLTISLLENGKISASSKVIKAAVAKLEVDENWLRSGDQASEEAKRIIEWLDKHPDDRRTVETWLLSRTSR